MFVEKDTEWGKIKQNIIELGLTGRISKKFQEKILDEISELEKGYSFEGVIIGEKTCPNFFGWTLGGNLIFCWDNIRPKQEFSIYPDKRSMFGILDAKNGSLKYHSVDFYD